MDLSGRQLLDAVSAPTPTPGGGSAAAFSGAMGTALLVLVASLPKTRHGTPDDREALDAAARALMPLRDHLAALVDEDTAAYDAVVGAYRLPKGTEGEKRGREEAIQVALRRATDVPLDVMRAVEASARESVAVARHGNPSAATDAGVGLQLLRAASAGASLNVKVNLAQLRDEAYVTEVTGSARRLEAALHASLAQAEQAFGG
jgi:formiminotetrahydrofolate cyclodeaminase